MHYFLCLHDLPKRTTVTETLPKYSFIWLITSMSSMSLILKSKFDCSAILKKSSGNLKLHQWTFHWQCRQHGMSHTNSWRHHRRTYFCNWWCHQQGELSDGFRTPESPHDSRVTAGLLSRHRTPESPHYYDPAVRLKHWLSCCFFLLAPVHFIVRILILLWWRFVQNHVLIMSSRTLHRGHICPPPW